MLDDGYPSSTSEDYEAYKARVRAVTLPTWITLKEPEPVYHLTAEEFDGTWVVYYTEEPTILYANPVEACRARPEWHEVVFDDSVFREEWCDFRFGEAEYLRIFCHWYMFKADGTRGYSTSLFPQREADQNYEIKQHFYNFLSLDKLYRKQPDEWITAYQWIYAHPVFWTRNERGDWNTEVGLTGAWISVANHSDTAKVLMEHGPHIVDGKAVGNHYMDHRLDVWAATFEDAYVAFAKKVDKYYDVYGEEREFEGDDREAHGLPPEVVTAIDNYAASLENGDLDYLKE